MVVVKVVVGLVISLCFSLCGRRLDGRGGRRWTASGNAQRQRHGCFAFCAFFTCDSRAQTGAQSPERSPRERWSLDFPWIPLKRYRHNAFSRQFRNLSLEQRAQDANPGKPNMQKWKMWKCQQTSNLQPPTLQPPYGRYGMVLSTYDHGV